MPRILEEPMRTPRLHRLTLLTNGVALLGFGISDLACHKDPPQPPEVIHINAPPIPVPSGATDPPPPGSGSAAASDGGAAPDLSAAASAPAASGFGPAPKPPIHGNAPRSRPGGRSGGQQP